MFLRCQALPGTVTITKLIIAIEQDKAALKRLFVSFELMYLFYDLAMFLFVIGMEMYSKCVLLCLICARVKSVMEICSKRVLNTNNNAFIQQIKFQTLDIVV